jgi:hypothetical protein
LASILLNVLWSPLPTSSASASAMNFDRFIGVKVGSNFEF